MLFQCIKENGIGTDVHAPFDTTYWVCLDYLSLVPVGSVTAFAGKNVPLGWLLCDGRQVSKEDFARLYAVIGDLYGTGTDSTFVLPKLTDNRYLQGGTVGGAYLNDGLPAITHNHTASSNSTGAHTHTASTNSTGAHTHTRGTMNIKGSIIGNLSGYGGVVGYKPKFSGVYAGSKTSGLSAWEGNMESTFNLDFDASRNWTGATSSDGAHTHTVTVNSSGAHTHTITVNNNSAVSSIYGSATSVQPKSLVIQYIIKY